MSGNRIVNVFEGGFKIQEKITRLHFLDKGAKMYGFYNPCGRQGFRLETAQKTKALGD